jgi:hypothetical protein
MLANTKPKIIPGEEHTMILLLPMISMYFSAKRVNRRFVPATIKPTAVGWSKPIDLNNVAE